MFFPTFAVERKVVGKTEPVLRPVTTAEAGAEKHVPLCFSGIPQGQLYDYKDGIVMENLSFLAVAHDTGGAQLLVSLVCAEWELGRWTGAVVPTSPADVLFKQWTPAIELCNSSAHGAREIFQKVRPDVLLTATSGSMRELAFIREARRRGIPSVSLLDHWINYRERFGYPSSGWENNVPDVVAVADVAAHGRARDAGFRRILPLKNYYLAQVQQSYRLLPPLDADIPPVLLVLSQVIPQKEGQTGTHQSVVAAQEKELLRDICSRFDKLARFLNIEKVVVRLHPAQPDELYSDVVQEFLGVPLVVERPVESDLLCSLQRATIVVGCSSMALFTATALGKKTYSFVPDGEPSALPLVGQRVIRSVEDMGTDAGELSAFPHGGVFVEQEYDFSHLLQQVVQ